MKSKILWLSLILSSLLSVNAYSQYAPKSINGGETFERNGIEQEDKDFILQDAEAGLAEHKKENGGIIDLAKFKPIVMKALYESFQAEEITRHELIEIKKAYERLESDSKSMDQNQVESSLRELFTHLFKKIESTKLQCLKENEQCNSWGCCNGLTCAAVPERARRPMNNCKRFRNECKVDGDCCSGECVEGLDKGKKVCAAVRRCFKPLRASASCDQNPICGEGECLPFNAGKLGINECKSNGNKCGSSTECCSNKCNRGQCVSNFICKNCMGQGIEPKRGEKCCEGLYKDPDTKKCIREMPPFVLPQVKVIPTRSSVFSIILVAVLDFSSSAHALPLNEDVPDVQTNFDEVVTGAQTNAEETNKAVNAIKNDQNVKNKLMMQQYGQGLPSQVADDAYKNHKLENFDVRVGSDFETCDIDLKADYLKRLKDYGSDGNGLGGIDNAIGMELALMSFEYMLLGDGTEDYWRATKSDSKTNVYRRMKATAEKHRENRHTIFKDLTTQSKRLQCLCWDKKGYPTLEPETQETFQTQCPNEFAIYQQYRESNPNTTDEDYAGDASGVKSQALMVRWLELLVEIEGAMSIQNTGTFTELQELSAWANQNNWGASDEKREKIYDWTMATSGYQVSRGDYAPESVGPESMAILVAGVVGVVAGIATLAWPGLWVTFGIIAGGASLGSAGMWMVGAMKGAWESRAPIIQDKSTQKYKCGKKTYCTDFKREFAVPFSPICSAHVSGNGCIKKFLVTNIDGQDRYLVDPFVPKGVSKSQILKDSSSYVSYFNSAYYKAKASYSSRKPSGRQGQSYLKRIFIDALQVGRMAPDFKKPLENYYKVSDAMKEEVKSKAIRYILDEGIFSSDIGRCDLPDPGGDCSNGQSPHKYDYGGKFWYFNSAKNKEKMGRDVNRLKDDMKKYSEYTYDFHWVWPRLAAEGMIAYPMPGFISYLELVSNTIGNKASINVGNVNDINNKLLKPQLQNLQATCQRYVESSGAQATGTIQGDCNRLISTRIEGNNSLLKAGGSIFDGMDDLLNDSVSFAGGFALGAENGKNSNSNMAFGGSTTSTGSSGSLSGGNVSGDGDSGLQAAAKARTKLREIRKNQLEKLENFKKAVGAERAEQLLSAQKAMTSKFNNPAGGQLASLGGGFGIAAGSLGKGSGTGKSALGDGKRGDEESGQNKGYDSNSNFNNAGTNYDLGYNAGSGSGSGSGNRETTEAQKRIEEAIEHRDESPEEWKNKSGDTLWKIITRTYIRNYDRLLKKRKKRINSDF